MIYVIIGEFIHPVTKERSFRAAEKVYTNADEAAIAAQTIATQTKHRAWACEFPSPPLFITAEIRDFPKLRPPLIK